MSKKLLSSLNTTVCIGYLAAGIAMSVSYTQMREIFRIQGGVVGFDYVAIVLPAAVLLGASAIWRMLGHLYSRYGGSYASMAFAFSFLALAVMVTEGVSIATSAMAMSMGVDRKSSSTTANDKAVGQAIQSLTASMSALPDNYASKRNETAAQIRELVEVQSALAAAPTATQKTFDRFGKQLGMSGEGLKIFWACLMALCLSLIVIAQQVFSGSLSGDKGSSAKGKSNVVNLAKK